MNEPTTNEFQAPPYGGLKPEELELLVVFVEECSETVIELASAIQAAQKVIRFGPDGCAGYNNLETLEVEMGHVRAAMLMLCNSGFVSKTLVHKHAEDKLSALAKRKLLQHQPDLMRILGRGQVRLDSEGDQRVQSEPRS